MRHNKYFFSIVLIAIIFFSSMLFYIKEQSHLMRSELSAIKVQIQIENKVINILQAELAYLKNPTRIRYLSEKYLKMQTMQLSQIAGAIDVNIDDVSKDQNQTSMKMQLAQIKNVYKDVNWRYKKTAQEYITKASKK